MSRPFSTWYEHCLWAEFVHLQNDKYNSLGSTCTCHYLHVGTNVSLQCRRGLVIHTWNTHGTQALVGGCPKLVKKTWKMDKDVLPLGQHLRRPAKASKSSWRPNPCQVWVCFGLQEQPTLKRMPRSHMKLDLGALAMDGNIISRHFQWHWSQAQIHPESIGIVRGTWRPVSVPTLRRCLSVFGPCIVLKPIRGASRGSCTTLESS